MRLRRTSPPGGRFLVTTTKSEKEIEQSVNDNLRYGRPKALAKPHNQKKIVQVLYFQFNRIIEVFLYKGDLESRFKILTQHSIRTEILSTKTLL